MKVDNNSYTVQHSAQEELYIATCSKHPQLIYRANTWISALNGIKHLVNAMKRVHKNVSHNRQQI